MTYISVNKHLILKNIKNKSNEVEKVIAVRKNKSSKPEYTNSVAILDKDGSIVAEFIYDPHKPILKCGARLVLLTNNQVKIK